MKKILFIIFLLIPSVCHANLFLLGEKPSAGAADCASGTYELAYNGDHSSGADYICYESGTASEVATANTASLVTTNYVEVSGQDSTLQFTISGDISADLDQQGSIYWTWRQVGGTDIVGNVLVELYYDASNQIRIVTSETDDRVYTSFTGADTQSLVGPTTLSIDTDYRCGYTWSATSNNHAIKCVTSGNPDLNGTNDVDEDEALSGFTASDPTYLSLGEDNSGGTTTGTVRISDVWITTDHKGTDPGPGL